MAITITQNGQSFTLIQPATRLVSLSPDLTEDLFAIGAGAKVIGVSVDSDYPVEARKLPQLGGYQHINIEAILALQPDLVLAYSGNPPSDIKTLQKLNVPVWVVPDQKLANISQTLRNLGQLTGLHSSANIAADDFDNKLHALMHKSQNPVRVFIEIDDHPLYTLSNKTIQGEIIQLCGGANIFGDLPEYAPQVSVESVIAANPQIIIALTPLTTVYWQDWQEIDAVQQHQLYVINADILSRTSPRILLGMQQVCKAINFRMNK